MSTPTPEPTTLVELHAAGWKLGKSAELWLYTKADAGDTTVFVANGSVLVTAMSSKNIIEADACRLAARLAAVLRDFKPTT